MSLATKQDTDGTVHLKKESRVFSTEAMIMGRWPDNSHATLITIVLMLVVFPLLCALAWWYVER